MSAPFCEWTSSVTPTGYYVAKYSVRRQVALMHAPGRGGTNAVAYFRNPSDAVAWCNSHTRAISVHPDLTCEDTCLKACLGLCGAQ